METLLRTSLSAHRLIGLSLGDVRYMVPLDIKSVPLSGSLYKPS